MTLMSHLYRASGCNIPITNNIIETRRLVLVLCDSIFAFPHLHFRQWRILSLCVPSLIIQWPAENVTFHYSAWL